MAKRKKRRAKKRTHVAARKTRKRTKKRSVARKTASNPRRRRRHHAKKHHAHARRARRANPTRRRHHGRRRHHRRNPGIPVWAMAGLAGAAGLGAYALATSAAFGLTKRFDPALTGLERNRYIAGGAMTAAGLVLAAFASPLIGAGVAAGGLAALAGTQLSFAIDPVFQLGASPAPAQVTAPAKQAVNGLGAVFDGNRQMLGAVFDGNRQQIGAVFNGQAQMLSGIEDDPAAYGFGG